MASRIEWIKFMVVMVIFMIGMIIMMINKVHNIWIWTGYIALWTITEMIIAKNIHLKWWVWLLIILGLSVLDLIFIVMLD